MNLRESIEIRPMTRQDLDAVLQIEGMSFPSPWSRTLFERELSTPFSRSFVAQTAQGKKLLGYLCLWLVDREAHILNLAVHPQYQKRGIGTLLLGHGIDYCQKDGVHLITLEVRRSNYKAISLYRNFHFQPQGIRRRYYTDSGEDAVVMGLALEETNPLSTV